jgi:uncharacterized membrane protein YeiB
MVISVFRRSGSDADLSNYLLTSMLCQTSFIWGPWKLYGKLECYQLIYLVFAVWVINLVVSSLSLVCSSLGRWSGYGVRLHTGNDNPYR